MIKYVSNQLLGSLTKNSIEIWGLTVGNSWRNLCIHAV